MRGWRCRGSLLPGGWVLVMGVGWRAGWEGTVSIIPLPECEVWWILEDARVRKVDWGLLGWGLCDGMGGRDFFFYY